MGLKDSAHDWLKDKPLKMSMNLLTIISVLCVIGVILWGMMKDGFDALRVIVSIYLFFAVVVVVVTSFPLTKIRSIFLHWFMFLATYNGKGLFLLLTGLLTCGMNTPGILVGIGVMLLGLLHILLWLFFSDLVSETVSKVNLSKVDDYGNPGPVDQEEGAGVGSLGDTEDRGGMVGPQYGSYSAAPEYRVAQPYNNQGMLVVDGQEQFGDEEGHNADERYKYDEDDSGNPFSEQPSSNSSRNQYTSI